MSQEVLTWSRLYFFSCPLVSHFPWLAVVFLLSALLNSIELFSFLGIRSWGIHFHFLCWSSTGSGDSYIYTSNKFFKQGKWNHIYIYLHIMNYTKQQGTGLQSLLGSFLCRLKNRMSCSSLHTPEYGDVWLCLSMVIDKLAKPLSHPSFIPYWELDFLSFVYSWIPFRKDAILQSFLFASKSGLHFNQLVIQPRGNHFLFTQDKSRSIRIQHTELEHDMYFTYEYIHSFYTIPQCGQGGSWSALYPPTKNTKIYVCFTGMWVGFCQPSSKVWTAHLGWRYSFLLQDAFAMAITFLRSQRDSNSSPDN